MQHNYSNELIFISNHLNQPIHEVALLLSKRPNLNKNFILNQINGRQKVLEKLPEFAKNSAIEYPTPISLEQCSSEKTALFKASIVNGKKLLDLTGGFGVDAYYFSKKFNSVTYVEQNETLFKLVSSNFRKLGAENITTYFNSAEKFLATNQQFFDIIYIDPARRCLTKKMFLLEDCSPSVLGLLPKLFEISPAVLIKTSPMLDIKKAISQLKFVSKVIVLSVKNECKEVLYLLEKKPINFIKINTVNIDTTSELFSFTFEEEETVISTYSGPKNYLYEPNSSIMKAGGFKTIASKFSINKISPNSHLYTSNSSIKNFPGRCFNIKNVMPYQPKLFITLGIKKANISCRNFIENVVLVKKRLKIKDGGEIYIFATTLDNNKPYLIVCEKNYPFLFNKI